MISWNICFMEGSLGIIRAERLCSQNLRLEKASNVKFTAVVDPNEDDLLILNSSIKEENGYVTLRGTAENKNTVAIKFQAVYQIK